MGICFRQKVRKGTRDGNECVPRARRSTFISQYCAINVFALVGTSLLDARALLDPNKKE